MALGALTRIAAAQLGPHEINVNAITPGLTRTPALERAFPQGDAKIQEMVAEGTNANFLGRVSESEDVAQTVVFLSSAGARQITGASCSCQRRGDLSLMPVGDSVASFRIEVMLPFRGM